MNLRHTGDTFCHLCGSQDTSMKPNGVPRWNKHKTDGYYNPKGNLDGESYICTISIAVV